MIAYSELFHFFCLHFQFYAFIKVARFNFSKCCVGICNSTQTHMSLSHTLFDIVIIGKGTATAQTCGRHLTILVIAVSVVSVACLTSSLSSSYRCLYAQFAILICTVQHTLAQKKILRSFINKLIILYTTRR